MSSISKYRAIPALVAGLILFDLSLSQSTSTSLFTTAAWADDDGGDDGDGDDGGDDGDNGDDGNDNGNGRERGRADRGASENPSRQRIRSQATRTRNTQARPSAPVPLQQQAPTEIVVFDLLNDDLQILLDEGFVTIGSFDLSGFTRTVTRLTIPNGVTLADARDRVRALGSGNSADFNHFYRAEDAAAEGETAPPDCSHENCKAWSMIGWPRAASDTAQCAVTLPIGILDTGTNIGHEILAGANLEVMTLEDQQLDPSKAIHGTAVASLLIGAPDSRVPGLIPEAPVVSVDVFGRKGRDERADLVSILQGLNMLVDRGVRVINLSLAGPENRLLEEAVIQMIEGQGIVVVAAAGNGGPKAKPAYPAGYDPVLAVTAVDTGARVYRKAQRGAHIDLAAPGVNTLAATSIRGARLKTGTSFAVPVVTAAAAIVLSKDPTLTAKEVKQTLKNTARDLGAPGNDEVFGYGLISVEGLCAP